MISDYDRGFQDGIDHLADLVVPYLQEIAVINPDASPDIEWLIERVEDERTADLEEVGQDADD